MSTPVGVPRKQSRPAQAFYPLRRAAPIDTTHPAHHDWELHRIQILPATLAALRTIPVWQESNYSTNQSYGNACNKSVICVRICRQHCGDLCQSLCWGTYTTHQRAEDNLFVGHHTPLAIDKHTEPHQLRLIMK